MSAEAPRQTVRISRNGSSIDLPVPFRPEDRVPISSLFPHCMIMMHYANQQIVAFPHGGGEPIVVYSNGHVPQK